MRLNKDSDAVLGYQIRFPDAEFRRRMNALAKEHDRSLNGEMLAACRRWMEEHSSEKRRRWAEEHCIVGDAPSGD